MHAYCFGAALFRIFDGDARDGGVLCGDGREKLCMTHISMGFAEADGVLGVVKQGNYLGFVGRVHDFLE